MRCGSWLLIVGILLAACQPGGQQAASREPIAVESVDIPQHIAELDSIEKRRNMAARAEMGDAVAAQRLADYYAMVGSAEDTDEQARWLARAAELGSSTALLNYALFLYEKGGSENCTKAVDLIQRYRTENPADHDNASDWLHTVENDRNRCSDQQ